jgi:hypothetical protein
MTGRRSERLAPLQIQESLQMGMFVTMHDLSRGRAANWMVGPFWRIDGDRVPMPGGIMLPGFSQQREDTRPEGLGYWVSDNFCRAKLCARSISGTFNSLLPIPWRDG